MSTPWATPGWVHQTEKVLTKRNRIPRFIIKCPVRMGAPEFSRGSIDRQIRHGNHAMLMGSLYQSANGVQRHLTPKRIDIVLRGSQQLVMAILPVVELKPIDMETRQLFDNSFGLRARSAEVSKKTISGEIYPAG